jgi:hypothetical protein
MQNLLQRIVELIEVTVASAYPDRDVIKVLGTLQSRFSEIMVFSALFLL